MVGKIKHVRQKIHQEAVKLDRPSSLTQPPDPVLPRSLAKPLGLGRHTRSPPLVENEKSENVKKVREKCLDKYSWRVL